MIHSYNGGSMKQSFAMWSLSLWGQLTQITVHRAMSKALMIGFVCAWCQTWCSVYIFSFSVCVCERQWKQLPKVLVCFVILLDFHKSHWCILTGNLFFLLYWIKSDFFSIFGRFLFGKTSPISRKPKQNYYFLKCQCISSCTFSDWASKDFRLLVTFFSSSSRSLALL